MSTEYTVLGMILISVLSSAFDSPGTIAAASTGNEALDVVFLIDGSGSVGADDFQLQKDAISNCLCGAAAVIPDDGSAAIAVVQFSSFKSLEIPLTIVDSETAAEDLCAQVEAIQQTPGGTYLTPGLDRAFTIFDTQAAGDERIVMLYTDAGIADASSAISRCDDLRSMAVPVKICSILIGYTCPAENTLLKTFSNTSDSLSFNLDQPEGLVACADDLTDTDVPCTQCVCADPGGPDCDSDGLPDVCEADCNNNGIPDDCEAADCNCNGIPDDEELDCNDNGLPDDCEVLPILQRFYVKADSASGGDGLSWSTAFDDLQLALDSADCQTEVWVAQGTYTPTKLSEPPEARSATFEIINGVRIYGGFAGDELTVGQRRPRIHETVLSGDIGVPGDDTDNAFHVVSASNTTRQTLLDGVVVTGGVATGPVFRRVGGGVFLFENGDLTINACVVRENESGYHGAGVYCRVDSDPRITNTWIVDNTAGTLQSGNGGGGLFSVSSRPVLEHCTLAGNSAQVGGGAFQAQGTMRLDHCIVWDNSPDGINNDQADALLSNIQGGYPGPGNFNADPLFVDPAAGDYHLQVASPCIDRGDLGFVEDAEADLDLEPRVVDVPGVMHPGRDAVDIGADEFHDCDSNGNPDYIDIAQGAADSNNDGVLDECEPCDILPPVVLPGSGLPGDTTCSGYLDPHCESSNGSALDLGITEVMLAFNEVVTCPGSQGLDCSCFVIEETGGGVPPVCTSVTTTDGMTAVIHFDRPITLQEWTTVIADVEDLCGNPIVSLGNLGPGALEPDRVDVGFLPANISQDDTVSPIDTLRFRQFIEQELVGGGICPTCPHRVSCGTADDFYDTDRDGVIDPVDFLRHRQALFGTGPKTTRAWAGESMLAEQP